MRGALLALLLLATPACSHMPWSTTNTDLSAEERGSEMELGSARAHLAASTRVSATERANLEATLTKAEKDLIEAKNLLSLETPPLDRVKAYVESANARIYSVRTYLNGV